MMATPAYQQSEAEDHESGENEALVSDSDSRSSSENAGTSQPKEASSPTNQNMPAIGAAATILRADPATKNASPMANSVQVPLEMLQKIVDFCAQTLRETTESRRILQDLERGEQNLGSSKEVPKSYEAGRANSTKEMNNIFKLPPSRLNKTSIPADTYQAGIIEEIWNEVEPWTLDRLLAVETGSFEEDGVTENAIGSSIPIEEFDGFFDYDYASDEICDWSKAYHHFLKHRLRQPRPRFNPERGYNLPFEPSVAICCAVTISQCYFNSKKATIGRLMEDCYKKSLLKYSNDLNSAVSLSQMLDNIIAVVDTCMLMNNVFEFPRLERISISSMLTRRRSIEEILGIEISAFFQILYFSRETISNNVPIDYAPGNTIGLADFHVHSLKSIGGLRIRFSEYLEDHLKLDLDNTTLSVVVAYQPSHNSQIGKPLWPLHALVIRYLPTDFVGCQELPKLPPSYDVNVEIAKTWAFLFATGVSAKKKALDYDRFRQDFKRSYDAMPEFPTDISHYCKRVHLGILGPEGEEVWYDEMSYHSAYHDTLEATLRKRPVKYSQFPLFETRLRELRHYMDSQKPHSLRQLWKDNRDSINYYTFWGVIIFGGLSVALALFSLAVSVAQTVAAFRTSPANS